MAKDQLMNYRGNINSCNAAFQDSTLQRWSPIPQKRAPKISAQSVRELAFAQILDRQHNSRLKAMQLLGKDVSAVLNRRLRRPLNYGVCRSAQPSGSKSSNPFDSAFQTHLDDAEHEAWNQELLADLDFQIEQSRYNDEHVHHQRRNSDISFLDADDDASSLDSKNRGKQPYCTGRSLRYRSGVLVSYGRPCDCPLSPHPHHSSPIPPKSWCESPAEADWKYDLPNGGHPLRVRKVGFADHPVSEVREFERWYEREYVKSNRYWCRGRLGRSMDESTPEDDEADIKALETEGSSSSSDDGGSPINGANDEGYTGGSHEDSDDESDWEKEWASVESDEDCEQSEPSDEQGGEKNDECSEEEEDYHSWLRVSKPRKSWPL